MVLDHLRRIVVGGFIGVGKTALVRCLADHLRVPTLFGTPAEDAFTAHFYEDPARYVLPVQLRLPLQCAERLKARYKATSAGERIVADSFLSCGRLLAQPVLSVDEFALYSVMVNALALPQQRTDLVVCLQVRAEDLLSRVARWVVSYETGIDAEYLKCICVAYGEPSLYYDTASAMTVDTAAFDPAGNGDGLRTLLTRIDAMREPKELVKLTTHQSVHHMVCVGGRDTLVSLSP